jgi:Zn-finger nucleic acid-binding protein
MICSGCGAAMETADDLNSSQCPHCGLHFPDEKCDEVTVVGEPRDVGCPLCRVPLVSALVEDLPVSYCGHCQGFLAATEIFRIIVTKRRALYPPHENSTEPFDPAELERVLACPYCQRRMETHPYFGGGNVVVDTCEGCGLIWLDAGELSVIERYVPHIHQIEPTLILPGSVAI